MSSAVSSAVSSCSDCPICMESLDSSATVVMSCKHRFCLDCVTKVLVGIGNECGKNSCPLCRCDMMNVKTFDEVSKHLMGKSNSEEFETDDSDSDDSDSDDSETDDSETDGSDDESDLSVGEINVLIEEIRAIKISYQVA